MPVTVPFSNALHPSPAAAVAALARVGAVHHPHLDLVVDVAGVGPVARRFGVLRNPLGREAEDDEILARFRENLARPENRQSRAHGGALAHTPGSKTVLEALGEAMLARRLHVPWALRPMNLDFAVKVGEVHRVAPFTFRSFYSQSVQVGGADTKQAERKGPFRSLFPARTKVAAVRAPDVTLGRLFSIPVEGRAEHTLLVPDDVDGLDDAVGVILEADAAA